MAVHEYAHARVAYAWGDTTAKDTGRMTLDPRANIYWPGFIIGVLIGFAILGSAPVNPHRMRDPRWGYFWAVIAGPISNLLTAVVFAIPFQLSNVVSPGLIQFTGNPGSPILPSPSFILSQMVLLNVLLFVFNLLPLSPLDGWSVVLAALPPGPAVWWQRYRQQSMWILFALVGLSFILPQLDFGVAGGVINQFNPLTLVVFRPSIFITRLLVGI